MNKNTQTNRELHLLHPLVITINLMVLLLMGNALGIGQQTQAADPETTATQSEATITRVEGAKNDIDTVVDQVCTYEMTKFGDPEFEKYRTFMEDHFKNKSTTSSLMEKGLQRYEQFKTTIRGKLELLLGSQIAMAAQSNSSNMAQLPAISSCEAKAQEYLDQAAQMLQMRAVTTSGIKKASIFVEKYKQINGKLRSLNLDIMKMVVNIRTFEEKLPCYLKSCI
jgi:uncharacterized membrane protein